MAGDHGFGPYTTERLLGMGATSQVWLAHGPDGPVALKLPRTDEHRLVLAREAMVLAGLDVPGVARLVDSDPAGDWLALELLDGEPFDAWAATRPVVQMARVAATLAETLAALHAAGTLHGDVKPSNVVVVDEDRPILIDLGLAAWTDEARSGFRGTLGFTAPEVLAGAAPTPAADAWSLGALIYAAVAGRVPFHAPDPAALAWLPGVTLPLPPSTWRPDLPAQLDEIALDLLCRRPEARLDLAEGARRLRAVEAEFGAPVLGMLAERDRLRRAIVSAGEGRPGLIVLYGPIGTGRRTLATEAHVAALREGLHDVAPEQQPPDHQPWVAVTRDPAEITRLHGLLGTHPGLLIAVTDRPGTAWKGAESIALPPLSEREIASLLRLAGADPADAADVWRTTLGHPASVHARNRAWVQQITGEAPDPTGLPTEAVALLGVLQAGRLRLSEAADLLGVAETVVLDLVDILVAGGWVREVDDGLALEAMV